MKPKAHISPSDKKDLREYFRDAVSYYDAPSTMAAQLEKAKFYSQTMKPCTACGGDRKKWTPGTGFVFSSKEYQTRVLLKRVGIDDGDLPGDLNCPKCNKPDSRDCDSEYGSIAVQTSGRPYAPGWVPGSKRSRGQITARPTGSSKGGSGVPDTGGTDELERYGRVDRLLVRVRRRSYESYEALARMHGPLGGSVVALWGMTPAGKTMMRGNQHKVPEHIYYDILRDRQSKDPDPNRGALFKAADQQASEYYDQACEDWILAVNGLIE